MPYNCISTQSDKQKKSHAACSINNVETFFWFVFSFSLPAYIKGRNVLKIKTSVGSRGCKKMALLPFLI